MDINKAWNNIRFDSSNLPKSIKEITTDSKVPLEKIKKSLLYNLLWGAGVTLLYPVMLYIVDEKILLVGFAVLLIFSLFLIYETFKLYKIVNPILNPENNILKELQYQYDMVRDWIRIQQKIGLLLYPISISVGFSFGGMLGSGLGLIEFINEPMIMLALLITIIVLTPLCYFFVQWMLKYSFKKDMEALQRLIDEINSLPS